MVLATEARGRPSQQTTRSDHLLAPLPPAKCLNGKGTANPPPLVLRTWGEREPVSNETAFAMLAEGPEQMRQADYILTHMQVGVALSPFTSLAWTPPSVQVNRRTCTN